jgi:hypothetical protein
MKLPDKKLQDPMDTVFATSYAIHDGDEGSRVRVRERGREKTNWRVWCGRDDTPVLIRRRETGRLESGITGVGARRQRACALTSRGV